MNEIEKDQLSTVTVQCFTGAAGNLSSLPGLIKRVIEERVWERRDHHGRIIELSNLRELITKDPIHGWGEDPRKIEALLKDDPVVLPMWREAMKEKPGPKSGDNITVSKAEKGTSKAYTLSRLQKQHPELYAQVCDGELSANAAAIKAGFRKVQTDFEKVLKLIPKLTDNEKQEIQELLKL